MQWRQAGYMRGWPKPFSTGASVRWTDPFNPESRSTSSIRSAGKRGTRSDRQHPQANLSSRPRERSPTMSEPTIYTALPPSAGLGLRRDSSRVYEDGGGSRSTTFERDGMQAGGQQGPQVLATARRRCRVRRRSRRSRRSRSSLTRLRAEKARRVLRSWIWRPLPTSKGSPSTSNPPRWKGKGSISRISLVTYLRCGFCRTGSGSDRVLVRYFSRESYPQNPVDNPVQNSVSPCC